MSRKLIAHLGLHSLPELADVAAESDKAIEFRCAALAEISFKLRLTPWCHRRDTQELVDSLDVIRAINPKAGKLSWYLRESRQFTTADVEAFLRDAL